jgi:hypothetical protein
LEKIGKWVVLIRNRPGAFLAPDPLPAFDPFFTPGWKTNSFDRIIRAGKEASNGNFGDSRLVWLFH